MSFQNEVASAETGARVEMGEYSPTVQLSTVISQEENASTTQLDVVIVNGENPRKRSVEGVEKDDVDGCAKRPALDGLRSISNAPGTSMYPTMDMTTHKWVPSAPSAPAYEDAHVMPWTTYRGPEDARILSLDDMTHYIRGYKYSSIPNDRERFVTWITTSLNIFIDDQRKQLGNITNTSHGQLAKSSLFCDLNGSSGPLEEIKKKAFCENAMANQLVIRDASKSGAVDLPQVPKIFDKNVKCLKSITKISEEVIKTWLEGKIRTHFPRWEDEARLSDFLKMRLGRLQPAIDDIVESMVYQLEIVERKFAAEQAITKATRDNAFAKVVSMAANMFCNLYASNTQKVVYDVIADQVGRVIEETNKRGESIDMLDHVNKSVEVATTVALGLVDYKVCKPAIEHINTTLTDLLAAQTIVAEQTKRKIEAALLVAELLLREVTYS